MNKILQKPHSYVWLTEVFSAQMKKEAPSTLVQVCQLSYARHQGRKDHKFKAYLDNRVRQSPKLQSKKGSRVWLSGRTLPRIPQ